MTINMNGNITKTGTKLKKADENELTWDMLTDKEKLVVTAMLVSKNDMEALKRSPVRKTQFYEYKKRLEPLKKRLLSELIGKSMEILQAHSIKAAETLAQQLDDPSPKLRQEAAESILDRSVGRPAQTEIPKPHKTIQPFMILGVPQSKIDALFQPDPDESVVDGEFIK